MFINLIKIAENSFNVVNIARTINYSLAINKNLVRLRSSSCPEFNIESPHILFLQGTDTERENLPINIPRPYLKSILFAIYNYNIAIALGLPQPCEIDITEFHSANILTHKFKCIKCHKNKDVSQFHNKFFDYCLECASELRECASCGMQGAEHKFGEDYLCNCCVNLHGFCQVCETDNIITRSKTYIIPEDYHGDNKYIDVCPDCFVTDFELGKEHHYHYKPRTYTFWDFDFTKNKRVHFPGAVNNKLFMGVEIEAMFDRRRHTNIVIGKVLKIYGEQKESLLYAKHDGTVPEPGTEFVTHPMTLNMFRSLTWKGLFDNVIKPETFEIGGHIHINKNAFVSPLHVYKFCKFLRTNVKYVEWISQRPLQEEWCKAKSRNGKTSRIAKQFKQAYNSDRYEMVNFTEQTIELRFFWSPSSTAMLLKNVEFVDALYNFTRNTTLHFDHKAFEEYVDKNSRQYPYLYNFIYTRQRGNSVLFQTNPEYTHFNNEDFNYDYVSSEPDEDDYYPEPYYDEEPDDDDD